MEMSISTNRRSNFPGCCESCKTSCNKSGDEFRKLLNLSNSELIVYINTHGKSQINRKESVILHNVGDKVLKKTDFFSELCRRKTKCYLCNTLIQRVCNLVNEVIEIKENEMIAVCEHCKKANAANKCKRCDEMIKKFLKNEINEYKYRQNALKVRLYEVRRILSFIVDKKNICSHKICQAYYDSNAELKILLELIKAPLPSNRSDIEENFSVIESDKDPFRENDGNTLLLKYKSVKYDTNESLNFSNSECFCICKYLRDRNVDSTNSFTFLPSTQEPLSKIDSQKVLEDVTAKFYPSSLNKKLENEYQTIATKIKTKIGEDVKESIPQKTPALDKKPENEYPTTATKIKTKIGENVKESISQKTPALDKKPENEYQTTVTEIKTKISEDVKENIPQKTPPLDKKPEIKYKKISKEKKNVDEYDKENIFPKTKKGKGEKKVDEENITEKTKRDKGKKKSPHSEILQLIKLAKDAKANQPKRTKIKERTYKIPTIPDLPEIKRVQKTVQIERENSASIIECGNKKPLQPNEMVYGNHIVPFYQHSKVNLEKNPLLFEVKHEFTTDDNKTLISSASTSTASKKTKFKSYSDFSADTNLDGLIYYELSNRKFIENGWTQLPAMQIVRKMNIYKMVPANPQFDWFANHERRNLLTYISGEKLAEVDENGCGRWFYKNGRVALEYYKKEDIKSGLKCVVYNCDDIVELKKKKSKKILASFDHLGNGIIYDNFGNVRLKYNQSEGLVIDKKIGPPGRWKWHTLNDPPELRQLYIETVEEADACLENVDKQPIYDALASRVDSEHMLAIEFENFIKAKTSKIIKSFKQFEIRMKTVKINDYFSVRIIDQANIQLLFRCPQVSLKVNMGMLLVSTEIVDTVVSDVSEVATPFDRPVSIKSISSYC